jgi:hypothetical protein
MPRALDTAILILEDKFTTEGYASPSEAINGSEVE